MRPPEDPGVWLQLGHSDQEEGPLSQWQGC